MKELDTLDALLERMQPLDAETTARIHALAQEPETEAMVLFENLDFTSSQFGASTVLSIGPGRIYATLDELEGRHLNDLPSQRQYPTAFWRKP